MGGSHSAYEVLLGRQVPDQCDNSNKVKAVELRFPSYSIIIKAIAHRRYAHLPPVHALAVPAVYQFSDAPQNVDAVRIMPVSCPGTSVA